MEKLERSEVKEMQRAINKATKMAVAECNRRNIIVFSTSWMERMGATVKVLVDGIKAKDYIDGSEPTEEIYIVVNTTTNEIVR